MPGKICPTSMTLSSGLSRAALSKASQARSGSPSQLRIQPRTAQAKGIFRLNRRQCLKAV